MKNSIQTFNSTIERYPSILLLLGVITMTLSHLSYQIDWLAWISMVPFLYYLRITKGRNTRLLFALSLVVAWSLIVLKIISEPIPYFFLFLYSIPIALIHLPGYLIWDRWKHQQLSFLIFPAMMTLLEWIQYTYTPLASWGAAAYTQVDSPVILQFVSLFGMPGLSFLIYLINILLVDVMYNQSPKIWKISGIAMTIVSLILFGTIRLSVAANPTDESIKVAAVGTDSTVGGLPLPSEEENVKHIEGVLSRTATAAQEGAKIIVWNEAAFVLQSGNEPMWLERFRAEASRLQVTLVASYVKVVSSDPLRFENKYVMIDPSGQAVETYLKHQPVPGEPAIQGQTPLSVYQIGGVNLGGAICYDYDFPYLANGYGELQADIVAVPSSDWKGIDPLHTQMAAFRAIEQGHSVLRSTRFGLSAGINPYGELVDTMSSFDDNNKIMITELPVKGKGTFYARIGDTFIYAIIFFLFVFAFKYYVFSESAIRVKRTVMS